MAEEELLLTKFTPAFKLVELEELIKQNRFLEAKSVARFIHSETKIPLQFGGLLPFFEDKDYKFLLSFMKYREGKLQSAISSLTVLEKEYPEMNRTKILKEEIENELKITNDE